MSGNGKQPTPIPESVSGSCLCESVEQVVRGYLKDLGHVEPCNLYELVLGEVERPLLQVIMEHTGGNQTKAAAMLGINRNTLRKKAARYGLDNG